MGKTTISWTDYSINPIRARDPKTNKVGHHCRKVSPGCANCYASRLQVRFGMPEYRGEGAGANGVECFLDRDKLAEVARRKKPTRYFWCDMTDLFGDWVPDGWINECFRVMFDTPQHTHQVLTKRAERMRKYVGDRWGVFDGKEYPPAANVWLGVSCENQATADERIPHLLATPAAVRFLSVEPLLSEVDLNRWLYTGWCPTCNSRCQMFRGTCGGCASPATSLLSWAIVGGESGPGSRPCNVEWVRSLVRQCRAANCPVFVKQLGANYADEHNGVCGRSTRWPLDVLPSGPTRRLADPKGGDPAEWPEDLRVRQFPGVAS